jgi:predicted regulator of Ras-like GTPase activity (Roadblock/LC7/MglB family)
MFRENLARMVDNVEGGVAGLLMGFDGIAVDTYARATAALDINVIGMEFSVVLNRVREAAAVLEVGGVQEIAIRAENLSVLVRVLNAEYFVALALTPSGNFGKGRYLLRVIAPRLQTELS